MKSSTWQQILALSDVKKKRMGCLGRVGDYNRAYGDYTCPILSSYMEIVYYKSFSFRPILNVFYSPNSKMELGFVATLK